MAFRPNPIVIKSQMLDMNPAEQGIDLMKQLLYLAWQYIMKRSWRRSKWPIKIRLTIVVTNQTESATPHRSLHVNILSRIVNVIQ